MTAPMYDDDPIVEEVAHMLHRIQANYEREGSGPGSRFAGQCIEAVQARSVVRHIAERVIAELKASQPDHLIQIGDGLRVIQHSMACRLDGRLLDCPYTVAAIDVEPSGRGTYRCSLNVDGQLVIGEAVAP